MNRSMKLLLLLVAAQNLTLTAGCDGLGAVVDGSLSIDLAIEAVLPERIPLTAPQEVTIIGRNFEPGVRVEVGGVEVENVFRHDDRRLTFLSPRLRLGVHQVIVRNPRGREVRYEAGLRYFAGSLVLEPMNEPLVPTLALDYLPADLDGDGLDDLVVLSLDLPRSVQVWLNLGGALGFEPLLATPTEATLLLAVADVTGDGLPDLVTNQGVHVGRADHTFGPPVPVQYDGFVHAVSVATFDEDAAQDLIVTSWSSKIATTRVLHFDAHGAQTTPTALPQVAAQMTPTVADVDGDGAFDLVFTDSEKRIRVAWGPEFTEQWVSPEALRTISPTDTITVIDTDGDGFLDLVHSALRVYLVRGLGGRGFDSLHEQPLPCGLFEDSQTLTFETVSRTMLATAAQSWPEQTALASSATLCGSGMRAFIWGRWDWLPTLGMIDVGTSFAKGRKLRSANLDGDLTRDLIFATERGLEGLFGSGHRQSEYGANRGLKVAPLVPDEQAYATVVTSGQFGGGTTVGWATGFTVGTMGWSGGLPVIHSVDLPKEEDRRIAELRACDFNGDGVDDLVARVETLRWPPQSHLQIAWGAEGGLRAGEVLRGPEGGGLGGQPVLEVWPDGTGSCVIALLGTIAAEGYVQRWQWSEGEWSLLTTRLSPGAEPSHPFWCSGRAKIMPDVDGAAEVFCAWYDAAGKYELLTWRLGGGVSEPQRTSLTPLLTALGQEALGLRDLHLEPQAEGGWSFAALVSDPQGGDSLHTRFVRGGLGEGTVSGIRVLELGSMRADRMVAADLDGDGATDWLVHSGPMNLDSDVHIVREGPDGALERRSADVLRISTAYTRQHRNTSGGIALADLDGDGRLEVVHSSRLHPHRLFVHWNRSE